MENIKIVSINVNGLNISRKRRSIFDHLRKTGADVCLLQETHGSQVSATLWKKEWGAPAFFNNGSQSSRGVAILVSRKSPINVLQITADDDGRVICMDLELDGKIYTVGSFYAPTQDKPAEQLVALEDLEQALLELTSDSIVLGGDFNCFLDPKLDKNTHTSSVTHSQPVRLRIKLLMENWGLSDLWRVRNPGRRGYTFRRGNYSSRLDYFFVSDHISEMVTSSTIDMSVHSDHALLSMSIQGNTIQRGPGFWKFDTALLHREDFILKMTKFLKEWSPPAELSTPIMIWEWMKYEIRKFVSEYTKKLHNLEKQRIAELNKELKDLYVRADEEQADLSLEIESVRRELREIEESRARKLLFRSRSNWALYGEKCSRYFLNLEKRNCKEKTRSSILTKEGNTITDIKRILEVGRAFYENLYQAHEDDLASLDNLKEQLQDLNLPQLSGEDKELLDMPLSPEELRKALNEMNHNKSPGSDGLPPEFYQKFWSFLSPNYCRSLQHSLLTDQLSQSQNRGIITLVLKRDVDRRLIENWRPITLLNTDYKIYTKALALRLQRVMGLLIHQNQTGFMRGRFIGDSVRVVKDSLEIIKNQHPGGLIVALDFSRAFDSVRWGLVVRALEGFNFGENFIGYTELIFQNVQSCLINSGTTSPYFSPGRGLRQGCCASPYFFLLVVELLSTLIRNNEKIKGIKMGQVEVKVAQFADDMTVMLADEASLLELLVVLRKFESWSGLTINRRKTKIISPSRLEAGSTTVEGIEVCDKAKILGIWIGLDTSEDFCYKWNFEKVLEKIQRVCDSWYQRTLSIKGKITVINSLLVSLLQYPCSIILTPERVFKEYKQIVTGFIWGNKKARIAYRTLILPVEDGGLKLIDLETRVKTNLLQWVKRIISGPDTNVAQSLCHLLGTEDLVRFFSYRSPPLPPALKSHKFYLKMVKLYEQLHDIEPTEENSIRRQILWYNREVGPKNSTIHWPRWERAGINTVGDLCHPTEGRLLSHLELQNFYGLSCTFLEALSMRLHIPSHWRNSITRGWQPQKQRQSDTCVLLKQEGPEDITSLSAKQMYKGLITLNRTDSAAFLRWTNGIDDVRVTNATEWREICARTFSATRETKLQSLQFKVINRIVPCGVHLKQLRIRETEECPLCLHRDSIVHFFFHCPVVQTFWGHVCAWFRRTADLYLDSLTPKEFMFGLPSPCHKNKIINFILMQVRFFIYRQKLFHNSDLSLTHWLCELRTKLDMEKWICRKLGSPSHFNIWLKIREELD